MAPKLVRRAALGLSLVCFTAAFAFAWWRSHPGSPRAESRAQPADGEGSGGALFVRHCGACHEARDLAAELGIGDRGPAALAMLEFLGDHADSSDAEDRRIVAHLLSLPPPGH